MNFVKFEAEHFDLLDNVILKVFRDYCYLHRFWIKLNFNLNKTYNTIILKAIAIKWNDK